MATLTLPRTTYVVDDRTASPHFPGIGRYVTSLTGALGAQLGADEQLLLLSDVLSSAPASPFSLRQQWSIPRLLRRIRTQATERVPTRVVYHSPYYLMPYRPGVPTVVTLHDLIPLLYPQTVSVRARILFRVAVQLALQAADHVIVGSEATRRDLQRVFSVESRRITSTPYAAGPAFYRRPEPEIRRLRQKSGLPNEYILYFGSNKPHKNLVSLIEAYAIIAAEIAAPLVIAGRWDPRYPASRQRVEALGLSERVRFLGPIEEADLPALYSGAQCFVFPSRYEGFGLPVLEALACGAPVACSNTSSLPQVAGDAAVYFAPQDISGMAHGLYLLASQPRLRQALSSKGLEQSRRFSWSSAAAQTLDVYRGLRA